MYTLGRLPERGRRGVRTLEADLLARREHEDDLMFERGAVQVAQRQQLKHQDRKSTRLNSSHLVISYAVFCLKKKNKQTYIPLLKHNPHIQVQLSVCRFQTQS